MTMKPKTAIVAVLAMMMCGALVATVDAGATERERESSHLDDGHDHDGHDHDGHDHDEEEDFVVKREFPIPYDIAYSEAREQFGLDGSKELVERLLADREAFERGGDWGFPVTAAEFDALEYVLEVARSRSAAIDAAVSLRDVEYAGSWMDYPNGNAVIGLVAESEAAFSAAADSIRKVAVHPDRLEIREVEHSAHDLRAGIESLVKDEFVERPEVEALSLSYESNAIVVSVKDISRSTAELLGKDVGLPASMLKVVASSGEGHTLDSNPYGGHRISVGSAGTAACSVGAHVKSNATSKFYLVTAGHCWTTPGQNPQTIPYNARHHKNGTAAGNRHTPNFRTMLSSWVVKSATADVQIMRHGWPHDRPQATRRVENWNGVDYNLRSVVPQPGYSNGPNNPIVHHAGDREGDMVCQQGHVTQGAVGHCGPITSEYAVCPAIAGGVYPAVAGMRSASYIRTGGDSGASVVFAHQGVITRARQLAGLHHGMCDGEPTYTFQKDAIEAMPFSVSWYVY